MAFVEPVVEDLYVEETASHPEIYKRCRRQNGIAENVMLRESQDRLAQENRIEMKRITREVTSLSYDLRRLVVDKSIYAREDNSMAGILHGRKPTAAQTEPKPLSAHCNLTAFVGFGRSRTSSVRTNTAKSQQEPRKQPGLAHLRAEKHWVGEPVAISSVRRQKKSRAEQMEQLAYCRTKRHGKHEGSI